MHALTCLLLVGLTGGDKKADGVLVDLDGVKSRAPAAWKAEKPANRLRTYQFRVAGAKEKTDAELAVTPNQPGKVAENLARWKELFEPPEGKTIEDVSKVEKFSIGNMKVVYLDIHGSYLHLPRPLAPKKDGILKPDYRMLAVLVETADNQYFIRIVGPAPTIAQHKAEFDAWLKNFK